jgi:perosamine synthetase
MNFIPLMVPDIQEADISEVNRVLRSGMLVQGAEVEQLEKRIAGVAGTPLAAAVTNGTATLHLALLALGIGKGDEVIVPAFSYIATANVVELVGAKPVFVDVLLASFNIDTDKIEEAITPRTKAIIPVHEFGLACDITRVMEIARKHGLYVIEDAACALGAAENGQAVGGFGDAASFSFHPRKAITSGEGGVLVSKSDGLIKKVKELRNHGIEMINGRMEFVSAGYNCRLTDFQAALINSQLDRLGKIIAYKQELAGVYAAELNSSWITVPHVPANKHHTWQTFHIILSDEINRDRAIDWLKLNGVGSNYGAQCMPAQAYFSEKYHYDCGSLFPNAMKAYRQGLAIPLYDRLSAEQIKHISQTLNKITPNI